MNSTAGKIRDIVKYLSTLAFPFNDKDSETIDKLHKTIYGVPEIKAEPMVNSEVKPDEFAEKSKKEKSSS